MNASKPVLSLAVVLLLVASCPAIVAADLWIRTSSPGQVEIFFDAVATNDYRIHQGDDLANLPVIETVSGMSGRVSREYPVTSSAGFFMLDQIPAPKPSDGFGEIIGRAFLLDEELTNSSPHYLSNAIDFGADPFDSGIDDPLLTLGGQSILASGSGGGSSLLAQVFAFEVLARSEGATLLKSGDEIIYNDPDGKKASFLVEIEGVKIGVTVTRGVAYPRGSPYTVQMAQTLLTAQLTDVLNSSANVNVADAWKKQILHIISDEQGYVETFRTAWESLSPSIKADTIVLVTTTFGDDTFLY